MFKAVKNMTVMRLNNFFSGDRYLIIIIKKNTFFDLNRFSELQSNKNVS